jgi:hypothetical protein
MAKKIQAQSDWRLESVHHGFVAVPEAVKASFSWLASSAAYTDAASARHIFYLHGALHLFDHGPTIASM